MRIAKFIARSGYCSRRSAERLIAAGIVSVNESIITDPVTFIVAEKDRIKIGGVILSQLLLESGPWFYEKEPVHRIDPYKSKVDERRVDNSCIYNDAHQTNNGNVIKKISSDLVASSSKKGSALSMPYPRLWIYNKPTGVITSYRDNFNRPTLFSLLPRGLPRLMPVGRLDYYTEGLILLSNRGDLAREMELPRNNLCRKYKCRYFGKMISDEQINIASRGLVISGVQYRPIMITRHLVCGGSVIPSDEYKMRNEYKNRWIFINLTEGKNREVRNVLEHFGLQVNRLIRIAYGDCELNDLRQGDLVEVSSNIVSCYIRDFNILV